MAESFSIDIKTLTGKIIPMTVTKETTVNEMKKQIETTEHYFPDQQRILYNGKELREDANLHEYSVQNNDILHLVLRLRGGMFHETSSRKDMVFLCTKLTLKQEIEFLERLLRSQSQDKMI